MSDKSLFSLEIICDKLYIYDNINCNFPVISFKFLNFPQIIIEQVDNKIADLIHNQLKSEKKYVSCCNHNYFLFKHIKLVS